MANSLTARQWVRREQLVLCQQPTKKPKTKSTPSFGTCWAKQKLPHVPYAVLYNKSNRYPSKTINFIRLTMQKLIDLKISKPFAAIGDGWFAIRATPYTSTVGYMLTTQSTADRMLYVQKLQPKLKLMKRKLLNAGVCLNNGLQLHNLALRGNQMVCANCADVVFSCLQTQASSKKYARQLKSLHGHHNQFPPL